ncbi:MAG: hypothetical protein ABL917_00335 [Parcubacteria group bacterium]
MENKKLWFKAKNYGWGWYPCTWEGWTVILLYVVAIVLHSINIDKFANSGSEVVVNFVVPFIINTIFLIIICYARSEKPEWRWGDK